MVGAAMVVVPARSSESDHEENFILVYLLCPRVSFSDKKQGTRNKNVKRAGVNGSGLWVRDTQVVLRIICKMYWGRTS